jgi:hypothetical protein
MKRLCRLLAFVFVFSFLVGCGSTPSQTNSDNGKVDPGKAGVAPPLPPPPPLPGKTDK